MTGLLSRLRPRLSFANVISMIALFAALGGGYASAFSGSGTLQKGAEKGITSGLSETVRTLTGVGEIQANCTSGDVVFYFANTSGEQLAIRSSEGKFIEGVPNNDSSVGIELTGVGSDFNGQFVGHISPVDGSKAPQVNLLVSGLDTDNCTTSVVDVLALNTQQ